MDYHKYFIRDKNICGGEYTIKGTRVTVRTILATLAEGADVDDILTEFPSLTREAIWAIIAYAADSAREDIPNVQNIQAP